MRTVEEEALREAAVWIEETGTEEVEEEGARREGFEEDRESGAQGRQDEASRNGGEHEYWRRQKEDRRLSEGGYREEKGRRTRGGEGAAGENSVEEATGAMGEYSGK